VTNPALGALAAALLAVFALVVLRAVRKGRRS
jgi:hypothetical protein